MRREFFVIVVLITHSYISFSQSEIHEAILKIAGAESMEAMDPYEYERLEDMAADPVRINFASLAKLEESGLMTRYQAVSLIDYRSRHGDVLSIFELAAVDGFDPQTAALLSHFISLEGHASLFETKDGTPHISHDLTLRSGFKDGNKFSYGVKYKVRARNGVAAFVAMTRSSGHFSMKPDTFAGNITWHSGNGKHTLVVGDYNARFGQGVALWNGMSMNGISSPSALMKRPAGISASSSFTGNYAYRGAAGAFSVNRIRFSPFIASDPSAVDFSILTGLNASVLFRKGQVSVTHYSDISFVGNGYATDDMKTAIDAAWCLKGTDVFSETSYDWKSGTTAFLAGAIFPFGEGCKSGVIVRAYPVDFNPSRSSALRSLSECSNEYALGMSAEGAAGRWVDLKGRTGFGSSVRRHLLSMSLDLAGYPDAKGDEETGSFQIKARADWASMMTESWKLALRVSERVRSWGKQFRTEVRMDLGCDYGTVNAALRTDLVKCDDFGFLTYAECGYVEEKMTIHMRLGLFLADDWDDRIYAYERDAPGSFNVPVYYGRGMWTSMMLKWRFSKWGRIYVRTSISTYALMKEKKPGKAELKLQFEIRL